MYNLTASLFPSRYPHLLIRTQTRQSLECNNCQKGTKHCLEMRKKKKTCERGRSRDPSRRCLGDSNRRLAVESRPCGEGT